MRVSGELDDPDESNAKKKDKDPNVIFLNQAINATKEKIYWRVGGAGIIIGGKSAEDIVHNAIVAYMERRRKGFNVNHASVRKGIYTRILNDLRKWSGYSEHKFLRIDGLEF